MRILQSLYDAGGGVPPQLAITRGLVSRGHDVRVLAHETLRGRVEERGAQLTPFRATLPGHDMTRPETDLVRDWEPSDPLEALSRFRDLVLFGPAAANAAEVLSVLDQWPADVVVLDWLLFGTALAAERANVPSVALAHVPYPLRTPNGVPDDFFAPGLAVMNEARAGLGLEPVDHWDQQLLNSDTVFVLTAPEVDPAGELELPANVRFAGLAAEPAPDGWESPWPATNADPLVVMSFSTTFMDQGDLAQRVLRAVEDLQARVLFTTGPALSADALELPDNVRVVPYVAHGSVLPQAALIVTHAGFGTVQAALSAGVPMVCLPSGRDQPANGARVEQLGVGRALDPAAAPEEIRAAILDVLGDPQFKRNAERMAAVLGARDGVGVVVDRVEALV
jgi:UDP:flavonoid glycosyltransferase YjiC (YdhE family)